MEGRFEAILGAVYMTISVVSHMAHDIFPVVTFIGALTGAILGCHGVYLLICNWLHRKHNSI